MSYVTSIFKFTDQKVLQNSDLYNTTLVKYNFVDLSKVFSPDYKSLCEISSISISRYRDYCFLDFYNIFWSVKYYFTRWVITINAPNFSISSSNLVFKNILPSNGNFTDQNVFFVSDL